MPLRRVSSSLGRLPTLDELFATSGAWLVATSTAGVAQYIRVAKHASGPVLRATPVPAGKRGHPGIQIQITQANPYDVPCCTARTPVHVSS